MALADEFAESAAGKEEEFAPRTEFDGVSGYIQTGGLEKQPDDYNGLLAEFGHDPGQVQIVGHPRISRWQQRAQTRDELGRRTGEFETIWLSAYRYHIEPRGLVADLPALYAAVRRTKESKQFNPKVGDSTVVVCWSDLQTGKVDYLGGLEEALGRLQEKRENLNAYLKRSSFDHIIVADAGDILEGFDNFPAQTRTNSLSLMDQVDVASTEFWELIKLCAQYAPVDVLSIPSNHCQWRRNGKHLAGKTSDDWGLHVSKRLERHNAEVGLPVEFHRSEDWMETLQFDVRNSRLGLAHGHQVNNPDQIKNWWAKMTHAGVLDCDILVTGHFHFPSLRPSGKTATGRTRWHVQASTLDNGSSWVRNKYGEDGDPALTVFQVGDNGFDVTSFALL